MNKDFILESSCQRIGWETYKIIGLNEEIESLRIARVGKVKNFHDINLAKLEGR